MRRCVRVCVLNAPFFHPCLAVKETEPEGVLGIHCFHSLNPFDSAGHAGLDLTVGKSRWFPGMPRKVGHQIVINVQ